MSAAAVTAITRRLDRPDDAHTQHVITGDDGGLWQSYDGGNKWWKQNNLPVSQFYHVSVDQADPFHVYGGLQDNSSWVGDSAYPGGVTNSRWENMYGGDGFWTFEDPADPNYIYAESQGGTIGRVNRKTHEIAQHPTRGELQREAALELEHADRALARTRRARSTSARSSCSARAITARAGTASRRISRPTIPRSRSRKNRAA